MSKMYIVTTCIHCPHHVYDNGIQCRKEDYRKVEREDEFILDEDGNAVECKTPNWCPLPDYKEE